MLPQAYSQMGMPLYHEHVSHRERLQILQGQPTTVVGPVEPAVFVQTLRRSYVLHLFECLIINKMLKGLSFEARIGNAIVSLGRHVVSILERQNELACHDILTIEQRLFWIAIKKR